VIIASTPSAATVASTPTVPVAVTTVPTVSVTTAATVTVTPATTGDEFKNKLIGQLPIVTNPTTPGTVANQLAAIAASQAGASNSESDQPGLGGTITARMLRDAVTKAASGSVIPPGPSTLSATGAPLLSAPTVKVDAADTGGANGQVIAGSAAALASGGSRTIMSGLLTEKPAKRQAQNQEPDLGQQPSQMNEESLLD
jgi:hypothetical protein